jgi:MurNAc alpha-1-phosphate uridylyltransferase
VVKARRYRRPDIQVVILAGGLASRLKNLTESRPKSLLMFNGKAFLEYQLELLRQAGIKNIVLCIGYLGEQIQEYIGNGEKYGMHVQYSVEKMPLGTAGALKNAEPLLTDPFFTMYGDSYVFVDFGKVIRYFQSNNLPALMTVYRNYNRFDRSNTAVRGHKVIRYDKEARTEDMVYIDYGVSVFRKEVLDMIPENQFYSLGDLFRGLISMTRLLAFEVEQRFYEIGSAEGLKSFRKFIGGAR